MTSKQQMEERVRAARAERDRLIGEAEASIKDAHARFASFLEIEANRVVLDEEKGKPVRASDGLSIAEAAGFKARSYLYQYIQRFKTSPKK